MDMVLYLSTDPQKLRISANYLSTDTYPRTSAQRYLRLSLCGSAGGGVGHL